MRNDLIDPKAFTGINIGCGHDHRAGYLNVDMDPACSPDIVLHDNNFSQLPKNFYEQALSHDVLEHIPRAETQSALLEWANLLRMGGELVLNTSNILGVAKLMTNSNTFADHHGYTICLFGNQVHPGDFHHTGFTETTLRVHMLAAGFEITQFTEWDTWLFRVHGRKIFDWTSLLDSEAASTDEQFVVAAYRFALEREPEDGISNLLAGRLHSGESSRREILKHLMASPERLYNTAAKHGL